MSKKKSKKKKSKKKGKIQIIKEVSKKEEKRNLEKFKGWVQRLYKIYKKSIFVLSITLFVIFVTGYICYKIYYGDNNNYIPVDKHIVQLDSDSWIKYEPEGNICKNIEKVLKNRIPFLPRKRLKLYNQIYGFIYKTNGIDYIDYENSENQIITKKLKDIKELKDKPLRYIDSYPKIILDQDLGVFKYKKHDFYDIQLEETGITETIDIIQKSRGKSSISYSDKINSGASYSYIKIFRAKGNPLSAKYTLYIKELIMDRGYNGIINLDLWGLPKKFYTLDRFKTEKRYSAKLNLGDKFTKKGFILIGQTKNIAKGSNTKEIQNAIFGMEFIGPKYISSNNKTKNRFPVEDKPFHITNLANLKTDAIWDPSNDPRFKATRNNKKWQRKIDNEINVDKELGKNSDKKNTNDMMPDLNGVEYIENVGQIELTLNKKYFQYNILKYYYSPQLQKSPSFKLKMGEDDPTKQAEGKLANSVEIEFEGVYISKKDLNDKNIKKENIILHAKTNKDEQLGVLYKFHTDLSNTEDNTIYFYLSKDRYRFGVFKTNTLYFGETKTTSKFFEVKFKRP